MKKLILICALLVLSGCKSNDINNLKYLSAVFVDNNIYTFQFANPETFAGEKESKKSKFESIEVSETGLFSAINSAEDKLFKKIDTSYLNAIIFSDKLSYKDILKVINTMNRSSKFHPDTVLAVTSSNNIIKNDVSFEEIFETVMVKSTLKSFMEEVKVLPVLSDNGQINRLCIFDSSGNKYECPENHIEIYKILAGKTQKINFNVKDGLMVSLEIPFNLKSEISNNVISFDIKIKGDILDNDDNLNITEISRLTEKKLVDLSNDFLNYNYNEKETDILNLKKHYKKCFLSENEWNKFSKNFNPKSLKFNIDINFSPRKDGILLSDN